MRAVTVEYGEVVVRECPRPEPGKAEVLVRVRAAGLNAADMLQRMGRYPAPPGVAAGIPGLEFAGEVEARGPLADRFSIGDRVMAVVGGGAQAELAVVHERMAMPVPDELTWDQAGGLPEAFTTAHDALFTQASLGLGESLLINGGAGGVGTAAIQLGRSIGAQVITTIRNESLHEKASELGATVIDPKRSSSSGTFDVVLELVGAPFLEDDLRALNIGGRLVVIGVGGGNNANIDLLTLMKKRARIHGSALRTRSLEDKSSAARLVERHVLPLVSKGNITVPVERTYPLEEASAAYEDFATGGKFGKLVLSFD